QIGAIVKDWQKVVHPNEAAQFEAFAKRIAQLQDFRRELVRRALEINPAAGREWGDNDANRSVRTALNNDVGTLAQLYADRSQRIYDEIDRGINTTAILMAVFGTIAVLVAGCGAWIICRAVARPLGGVKRTNAGVAAGALRRNVPFGGRT